MGFKWKCVLFLIDASKLKNFFFSGKLKKTTYPPLVFNNRNISQTNSQKDMVSTLGFQLIFNEYLPNILSIRNKTIGLLGNPSAPSPSHRTRWNPPWRGEGAYLTKRFQPVHQQEELLGAMLIHLNRTNRCS